MHRHVTPDAGVFSSHQRAGAPGQSAGHSPDRPGGCAPVPGGACSHMVLASPGGFAVLGRGCVVAGLYPAAESAGERVWYRGIGIAVPAFMGLVDLCPGCGFACLW